MTHGAETSRVGQFCSIIPPWGGSLLRYQNHMRVLVRARAQSKVTTAPKKGRADAIDLEKSNSLLTRIAPAVPPASAKALRPPVRTRDRIGRAGSEEGLKTPAARGFGGGLGPNMARLVQQAAGADLTLVASLAVNVDR